MNATASPTPMLFATPPKRTQVLERPAPPDYSAVPAGLAEWAAGMGKNLVLSLNNPMQGTFLHARGMYVLDLSDLPESDCDRFTKEARQAGYVLREGQFVRGDCVLYLQDESAREAMVEEALAQFLAQDTGSMEAAAEQLREFAAEHGLSDSQIMPAEGSARSIKEQMAAEFTQPAADQPITTKRRS